jgi:hypothetical protein
VNLLHYPLSPLNACGDQSILSNTFNIAVTPPGGIQGAITIPNGFFECLRNAHHSAQLSEIPFTGGFESRSPASFL